MSRIQIIAFSFLIVASIISVGLATTVLIQIIKQESGKNPLTECPTEPANPADPIDPGIIIDPRVQNGSELEVGDNYVNDTIFLVTKNKPHKALIATVSRSENTDGTYNQSTRASYFNGQSWDRATNTSITATAAIYSNNIATKWDITVDPSKVLKQTVDGTITIHNHNFEFTTDTIGNELPIRSLPEYTKFVSNTTGSLTVDNEFNQVNILYVRIYSNNAKQILVYDSNFKFNTDWLVFWDDSGSFYHVDKTRVYDDVTNYVSHSIAYMEDPLQRIARTFDVDISSANNLITYALGNGIDQTVNITPGNTFEKYPGIGYPWDLGLGEGYVTNQNGQKINGFGIYEIIDNR